MALASPNLRELVNARTQFERRQPNFARCSTFEENLYVVDHGCQVFANARSVCGSWPSWSIDYGRITYEYSVHFVNIIKLLIRFRCDGAWLCCSVRRINWLQICQLRGSIRYRMLLRYGQVQRGNHDVIVRSRDHGCRPDHQRRHWLPALSFTFSMMLMMMICLSLK